MSKTNLALQSPITEVSLIGPAQSQKLERLNIHTVKDLLYHFPVKYKDTSEIISIEQLHKDREGTVKATIKSIKNSYTRRGLVITKATIEDESGTANLVWFNQRYIINSIKDGLSYFLELKLPDKPGAKDFYCNDYCR